ncbi:MAG: S41 family peptidase [Cyanobacteria bacterium J06621_11]
MGNKTALQRLEEPAAITESTMAKKGANEKKKGTNAKKKGTKANKKNVQKKSLSTGAVKGGVPALEFLAETHPAVRSQFDAVTQLTEFLDGVGKLTLRDRQQLVEQALVLIQENFVHLPMKEAMHGVDPIQKLRLIQHRLNQATDKTMDSEIEFHRDMSEVFTSVRDLHTNYLLPAPFAGRAAFLPFNIEECFDEKGKAQYIATHFVQGFSHEYFKKGVKIVTWNAVPIARAVAVSAHQHAGSNADARHAQGIDGLTIRPLTIALPPDALWVDIGYIDLDGEERELRQPWLVTPLRNDTNGVETDEVSENAVAMGTDLSAELIQKTRKMLFAPSVIAKEDTAKEENKPKEVSNEKAKPGESLETTMDGIFRAQSVTTASGEYGYIRVFSFNVRDPDAFIDEFIRLAELLPQQGLIIDMRSNGGGHIYASEGLLQTITPGEITPEPTQFLNTPLNARICERHRNNPVGIDLSPWVDSIQDSVETGAVYSRGFPITPYAFANGRGQKYHGPTVLITNARCYSATDIFAAGFQDHKIGHILGVDGNTGAGGANVWDHGLLRELLRVPEPADRQTPYEPLPHQSGMRVAVRRTLRVGEQAGTPVEDLGVVPDSRHALTKNDLLNGNQDLIDAAAAILKKMPVRLLTVKTKKKKGAILISVDTAGFSRLDVYFDGRPVKSVDVKDGSQSFDVPFSGSVGLIKLMGYEGNECVAERLTRL